MYCEKSPKCRWHKKKRCHLQAHGTLRELLDILSTWTCPVKRWEITTQTSVLESLGEHSQELRKVWNEISRIFALSIVLRPRDVCIVLRVNGLGNLKLDSVNGTCPSHVPLLAHPIVSQIVTLSSTVCGPSSTTRMTMHWPT